MRSILPKVTPPSSQRVHPFFGNTVARPIYPPKAQYANLRTQDQITFSATTRKPEPTPLLTKRFDQAMQFARKLHATQTRKGSGIPYFAHLSSVASIVLKHGGDEDEAIAALLHDAVEDQGGTSTLAIIRKRFGKRVAEIVMACSDTDVIPKPPWRARKEAYIHHIASASLSARLVSAADKLDNCRDTLADYQQMGESIWSRFNAPNGKYDVVWNFRELVKAFKQAGDSPLIQELDQAVTQLEQLIAAND